MTFFKNIAASIYCLAILQSGLHFWLAAQLYSNVNILQSQKIQTPLFTFIQPQVAYFISTGVAVVLGCIFMLFYEISQKKSPFMGRFAMVVNLFVLAMEMGMTVFCGITATNIGVSWLSIIDTFKHLAFKNAMLQTYHLMIADSVFCMIFGVTTLFVTLVFRMRSWHKDVYLIEMSVKNEGYKQTN